MSATTPKGAPSLAHHIAATTHGIGRPRAYRKRRRVTNWLRLALGIAALVALLAKHL